MLRYLVEELITGLGAVTPRGWDLTTVFYGIVGALWLLGLVSAMAVEDGPWGRWLRWRWLQISGRAYAIGLAGLMLLTRCPLIVAREMNADESLVLGTALVLKNGGAFYVNADSETSGPLNVLGLLVGPVFGMPLDHAWIRLHAALIWVAVVLVIVEALRGWVPEWVRRSTGLVGGFLPASLQGSGMGHNSSELMPTLLIAVSALVLMRVARGEAKSWAWPVLAGIVWGLSPFSKPQGIPVEAAIGLLLAIAVWQREPRRRLWLGVWVMSAVVSVVAVLGSIAVVGGWDEFVHSFILRNVEWAGLIQRPAEFYWTWGFWENLVFPDTRMFYLWFRALMVVGLVVCRWRIPEARWPVAGGALILMASIYAAGRPGTAYPHHALMLTAPVLLGVGLLLRELNARSGRLAAIWCVVMLVTMVGERATAGFHIVLTQHQDTPEDQDIAVGSAIFRYADRGERLGVWGWTPRLYTQLGMPPATQYITMAMQFLSRQPLRGYFVDRHREELMRARPPVVIDTSGSTLFVFDETYRLASMDGQLQRWVEANYVLTPENPDDALVWVRKDRYREREALKRR